MDRFKTNLVVAVRGLRRSPTLVAGAILTLAVSAGINLAMVGLIDRALLSPPALVNAPEQVFTVGFSVPGQTNGTASMSSTSYVTFKAIRDGASGMLRAGAFQRQSTSLMLDSEQHSVEATLVSGSYFGTLGARARRGRALDESDDSLAGAESAAVLSHEAWRRLFHADPGAIGQRVSLGGLDYIVVGVMPESFSGHSAMRVDVWVPFAGAMRTSPGWDEESFRNVAGVVVRLNHDVNVPAATTRVGALLDRRVALSPIVGASVAGSERRIAWWLCALAALVFIVGLANAGILLMVRGSRLRQGMSVRLAVGASSRQLVAHATLEAFALSVAAVATSLLLASWMDESVRKILFPGILSAGSFGWRSLSMALGATMITTLVIALASISQLPRPGQGVRPSGGGSGQPGHARAMKGLLVGQTALAMILLAGAGVFGASLYRLWNQDFGMRLSHAVVVDFEEGAAQIAGQDELFASALSRIRALPGVELATPIDALPFAGFNVPPIAVPGLEHPPSMGGQLPFLTAASPEFFRILGIDVVQGRSLTESDDRGAPVVLVNETMAKEIWPGQSAVGKCIRIGFDPDFNPETFDPSSGPPMPGAAVPCREVVGVTRDIRQRSVLPFDGEDRWMQYFVPFSQVPKPPFINDPTHIRGLLLRTAGDAASLSAPIRKLIVADRADLPYLRVRPYTDLLSRQMRPWEMGARLLGLFSALALCVAAIGLYAAFAHAVSERLHEMAVRSALGAEPSGLRRLVLREAMRLAAIGVALGVVAAAAGNRMTATLLFQTSSLDPVVLTGCGVLMLATAALATSLPAYRASKADPSILLRAE